MSSQRMSIGLSSWPFGKASDRRREDNDEEFVSPRDMLESFVPTNTGRFSTFFRGDGLGLSKFFNLRWFKPRSEECDPRNVGRVFAGPIGGWPRGTSSGLRG